MPCRERVEFAQAMGLRHRNPMPDGFGRSPGWPGQRRAPAFFRHGKFLVVAGFRPVARQWQRRVASRRRHGPLAQGRACGTSLSGDDAPCNRPCAACSSRCSVGVAQQAGCRSCAGHRPATPFRRLTRSGSGCARAPWTSAMPHRPAPAHDAPASPVSRRSRAPFGHRSRPVQQAARQLVPHALKLCLPRMWQPGSPKAVGPTWTEPGLRRRCRARPRPLWPARIERRPACPEQPRRRGQGAPALHRLAADPRQAATLPLSVGWSARTAAPWRKDAVLPAGQQPWVPSPRH